MVIVDIEGIGPGFFMKSFIHFLTIFYFWGWLWILSFMCESSVFAIIIHKNFGILAHVSHVVSLVVIVPDDEVLIDVFVEDLFATSEDWIPFHLKLFQVFRCELNLQDSFVEYFVVVVEDGLLNEVVAELGLSVIVDLVVEFSRVALGQFLIQTLLYRQR